jgi:hypothetical protein
MKRLMTTLAAVALIGAAAGCATPTPYQPDRPGAAQSGGFSENQIEANRFRVTFSGNSLTSRETVESYLLYRAAELTVNQGYDWFMTADRRTEKSTSYMVDPDPFYTSPFYQSWGYGWRPSWRYYGGPYGWRSWDPWGQDPFWANSMDVQEINRYEANAEIVMGHGAKPADNPVAFDARAVMANLGPAIVRPAPGR